MNKEEMITKEELEQELRFPITNEEYATAEYCQICEVWTIFDEMGYPLCYCN